MDEQKFGPDREDLYGMAAVSQSLEGLEFPATKQQVLEKLRSQDEIPWAKDNGRYWVVFDRLPDQFQGVTDVTSALSYAIMEETQQPPEEPS